MLKKIIKFVPVLYPCILSALPIKEFFSFSRNGETYRIPIFVNKSLQTSHPEVTRVVVSIHGDGRDPDGAYQAIYESALQEGQEQKTLIMAPFFQALADSPGPKELYWSEDGWKQGDFSLEGASMSTITVVDEIFTYLDRSSFFTFLEKAVLAGHSAGGQFVQRYALGSNLTLTSFGLEYIVANPSSYLYLNSLRPDWAGLYPRGGAYPGVGLEPKIPSFLNPYDRSVSPYQEHPSFQSLRNALGSLGGNDCQCSGDPPCSYEKFKYGFPFEPQDPAHPLCTPSLGEGQTCLGGVDRPTMVQRFLSRRVTYLLGQKDNMVNPESTTTNGDLDLSCAGNFQGPDRLSRGMFYYQHLATLGPSRHRLLIAEGQGHSTSGVFKKSYRGRRALFGTGPLPEKEFLGGVYTISQKSANTAPRSWILSRIGDQTFRLMDPTTLGYLDAYTSSSYKVMTQVYQEDTTQVWILEPVSGRTYRIRQGATSRYLDTDSFGGLVTRRGETDDTQKWVIGP
jgi:hypothetical protein